MQSVLAIRRAIETGETTPRGAIERCLDAIEARDGEIGAFAALADRKTLLAQAERATGPLAGIALGVKDIFDTFDLPTTYGSQIYAGHRPLADAAVVAMARRAGGTIVGKTVTTEFAFLEPAGTRNPHSLEHTPGGSSSGSAAAVAAGMVPAAIGTQTGGSIVRPAAYCGVAGYKPSFRLVPATGMKTFAWTLDTVGFFAASVADVAALAAAVSGRPLEVEPVEATEPRIGLYRTSVWDRASGEMRAAVEETARLAEAAGATIVEIDEPGELAAARDVHATIQNFEAGLALAGDHDRFAGRMSALLAGTLAEGRAIAPAAYDEARGIARRARHTARELFANFDALLTPAATGAAPRGLASTGDPVFNKLWTLTGNPCVNVPGTTDAAGLPLGVQVVGRFGRDRRTLAVASWLEGLIGAKC